jgi:hypothetical protein
MNPFQIRKKIHSESLARARMFNREEHWFTTDLYRRLRKNMQMPVRVSPDTQITSERTQPDDEIMLIRYRCRADLKQEFSATFASTESL